MCDRDGISGLETGNDHHQGSLNECVWKWALPTVVDVFHPGWLWIKKTRETQVGWEGWLSLGPEASGPVKSPCNFILCCCPLVVTGCSQCLETKWKQSQCDLEHVHHPLWPFSHFFVSLLSGTFRVPSIPPTLAYPPPSVTSSCSLVATPLPPNSLLISRGCSGSQVCATNELSLLRGHLF